MPIVLRLFAESVRDPSESAHLHAAGKIEALHIGRADFLTVTKQTNRARQTFQRSAEQAKVFNETRDRLVLPAGVSLGSTPLDGGMSREMETAPIAPSSELDPML